MADIGLKEAAVLSVLFKPSTVIELTDRLAGDVRLDDMTVYLALKRMLERRLVDRKTVRMTASDGKVRSVGMYRITGQGEAAFKRFVDEASPVIGRAAAFVRKGVSRRRRVAGLSAQNPRRTPRE